MENKEIFSNNNLEETQPVNVSEEKTSPANDDYDDGFENVYSSSPAPQAQAEQSAPSAPQPTAQAPVYTQPNQSANQTYYQQPVYTAPPYNTQYGFPQHYDANGNPVSVGVYTPKKKSAGKKAALTICALALVAAMGVGGGFLGVKLAGMTGENTIAVSQSSNTASSSSKSETKDDSALKITQASSTDLKPTSIEEVVAKVKDSVVEITTETTSYDSFYGQYVSQAAGSGVIITEDGYILTNNHVIEDASSINVRLTNGNSYEAKVIGADSTLDIALIKIEEKGLTTSTFGDSSKLNVGQQAIAIGNPLGRLGGTVTEGIISALDREIKIDGKTMTLLQTSAAINPGNSGGGLYDAEGNLIGIVVAKSGSTSSGTSVEGLGFAIPVNNIIDVLSDLKTNGRVTGRGYLGVSLVNVTGESAMFMYRVDKEGVYISAVYDGTAAEKAGLKIGDLVKKVDDNEITSVSDLNSYIIRKKAGDTVRLTIERDGKEITVDAVLGERPSDDSSSTTPKNNSSSNGYNDFGGFFGG